MVVLHLLCCLHGLGPSIHKMSFQVDLKLFKHNLTKRLQIQLILLQIENYNKSHVENGSIQTTQPFEDISITN